MRNIVLAVNANKNNLHPEFVKSITETVRLGQENDIIFYFDYMEETLEESVQRNILANRVLNSKVVEGLVFVSPRVSWQAKDMLTLVSEEKDGIVSGVYPLITYGTEEYPVILEEGYDIKDTHLPLEASSLGFAYIPKTVLESVKDSVDYISDKEMKFYYFFAPEKDGEAYYEDVVTFCRKVKKAGNSIWLDPTLNCQNHGTIGLSTDYQKYLANHWLKQEMYGDTETDGESGPILDTPAE